MYLFLYAYYAEQIGKKDHFQTNYVTQFYTWYVNGKRNIQIVILSKYK